MAMMMVRLFVPATILLCLLAAPWLLFYSSHTEVPGSPAMMREPVAKAALWSLQQQLKQCVEVNGLGLQAEAMDYCKLVIKYPKGTDSTWYNRQFKVYEPLEFVFDVCETLLLWEQYRNVTSILTREYLDARHNGWLEYAPKRISQFGWDKCHNKSLCEEELQLVLPANPPFKPRQFATCAVVGNSGDLLLTEFGPEIDAHDAVIRDNEAPVNETYAKHVGLRRDFRLIAEGVARNLQEVVEGNDEVLIIKSKIHRDFNAMIKKIPNPVYLFQGVVFRNGAKGTGIKSIELAVSMCDSVDIYGFTVDPGYANWTRYFSKPRRGHNPLRGRAYYQLLECLGIIKLHSPLRGKHKLGVAVTLSRKELSVAHTASMYLHWQQSGGLSHSPAPFSFCGVWATGANKVGPLSGSPDMSRIRKASNYSKWEKREVPDLRAQAKEHQIIAKGVSFYKMDGNKLQNLLCIKPHRTRFDKVLQVLKEKTAQRWESSKRTKRF